MPCFFSKVQLFHNSARKPPAAKGQVEWKEGGRGEWKMGGWKSGRSFQEPVCAPAILP